MSLMSVEAALEVATILDRTALSHPKLLESPTAVTLIVLGRELRKKKLAIQ